MLAIFLALCNGWLSDRFLVLVLTLREGGMEVWLIFSWCLKFEVGKTFVFFSIWFVFEEVVATRSVYLCAEEPQRIWVD